jgi:hypothetical protein
MSNYSNCALHVIGSKTALDNQQTDIIDGYLQVLREDLPYFEAFRATRVNDEYLRLCFDTKESHASTVWPPLSRLPQVNTGEALVFLLTSSSESYCWNDCAAKIQVLRDEGDDRAADIPQISQVELASAVRGFANVLATPWQTEEISISYEIDCTALVEKAKQLPPKEAARNVSRARPDALDDLDIL